MTEDGDFQRFAEPNVTATCGECGRPVVFDQFGPHSVMAVCGSDPEHAIGPAAQRVLDRARRDTHQEQGLVTRDGSRNESGNATPGDSAGDGAKIET